MSADALAALHSLDPGMAREPWVKLAFACKDAGITESEWLEWCERAENFDRADAITTFRNAKPRAGGVTSATLFMMARDAGYKPESAHHGGGNGQGGAVAIARPVAVARVEAPPPTDPAPVWEACAPVDVHGYLTRKKIKAHGARVNTSGWLVVPYYNRERQLQTVQNIAADGTKRFLAGARQKGSVAILGEPQDAPAIVVAEGFATSAAIRESTGLPVLAAGSRVSFPEAAKIARHFTPHGRVVIAADRDDLTTPMAAARAVAGFVALPGPEDAPEGFDFCDWRNEGAPDSEIAARIDHAKPVATEPAPTPAGKAQAARTVAKARAVEPGALGPYLLDAKGRVLANLANLFTFMASGAAGDIRHDIFTGVDTWRGMPMREASYSRVTRELQAATIDGRRPFTKVAITTVADALHDVADEHSYNSCVDWLDTLPAWDGVERIARFFSDVAEREATDYLMGVGRYFWLGMVARMVAPGAQVDSTVCLVGPQGIGKSSLARIVGGERYGEVGLAHIGERDWVAQLRGKVVVEINELSGHTRAELETIKAILTRTADEYRLPYGRTAAMVPRGNVFVATTNERDFLLDAGGNRRWFPVQCRNALALEEVRMMREQYFAEAYALVSRGLAPLWHVVPDAADVQATHMARDPWIDALDERLRETSHGDLPATVANTSVYDALKIPAERQTGGGTGRRITAAMRALGYRRAKWYTEYPSPIRQVRGFERGEED